MDEEVCPLLYMEGSLFSASARWHDSGCRHSR